MVKDNRTDSQKVRAILEGAKRGGEFTRRTMKDRTDEELVNRILEGAHKGGQRTKEMIAKARKLEESGSKKK